MRHIAGHLPYNVLRKRIGVRIVVSIEKGWIRGCADGYDVHHQLMDGCVLVCMVACMYPWMYTRIVLDNHDALAHGFVHAWMCRVECRCMDGHWYDVQMSRLMDSD